MQTLKGSLFSSERALTNRFCIATTRSLLSAARLKSSSGSVVKSKSPKTLWSAVRTSFQLASRQAKGGAGWSSKAQSRFLGGRVAVRDTPFVFGRRLLQTFCPSIARSVGMSTPATWAIVVNRSMPTMSSLDWVPASMWFG